MSILTFLAGLLVIYAKYKDRKYQQLIFKPLALICIISIVIFSTPFTAQYSKLILYGLLFSLIGDIFLIFPERHFVKGLSAFLIGHIFYILAFFTSTDLQFSPWIYIPILVVGLVYLYNIVPFTGRKAVPVILYVLIIGIMGWLAFEGFSANTTQRTLYAMIGATLFLISDSVLAWNKFRKSFISAEAIILATYFLAQWFLALSAIRL